MGCTLKKVALTAGVSTATVSRVINGTAGVSQEMRTRVLLAISDIGYRPNEHASMLGRATRGISRNKHRVGSMLQTPKEIFYLKPIPHKGNLVDERLEQLERENEYLRDLIAALVGR